MICATRDCYDPPAFTVLTFNFSQVYKHRSLVLWMYSSHSRYLFLDSLRVLLSLPL